MSKIAEVDLDELQKQIKDRQAWLNQILILVQKLIAADLFFRMEGKGLRDAGTLYFCIPNVQGFSFTFENRTRGLLADRISVRYHPWSKVYHPEHLVGMGGQPVLQFCFNHQTIDDETFIEIMDETSPAWRVKIAPLLADPEAAVESHKRHLAEEDQCKTAEEKAAEAERVAIVKRTKLESLAKRLHLLSEPHAYLEGAAPILAEPESFSPS